MKKLRLDILLGPLLAMAFLALYVVTRSQGAAPGPSAGLLLHVLDLFPRLTPQSPFWFALARGLAGVSGLQAITVLNVASALCGALAVGLLYDIMRKGVALYLDPYLLREGLSRFACALAGFVAALSLGLTAPFWSVSNRAFTASFDVMLLLLAARLLLAYIDTGLFRYAVILTLTYGFLAAEFVTMIVVGPLFAVALLYGLWRHEQLRPRRLGPLAVLLCTGIVSGYLLATWLFFRSPGFALREHAGFGNLLWAFLREQAALISRSLPREGWLVILMTTTVPWLAMFAVARRGLNDDRDKALVFLHLLMTVFVLAIWLHVPLTPWRLLGWQRMLVTPYVITAMVSGYLATFWFLAAGEWTQARENGWLALLRLFTCVALTCVLLAAAAVLPWFFRDETESHGTPVARAVAGQVVESLEGRTWLVSDGVLDSHYYLAAWERGLPLQILSLPSGNQSLYLGYVAGLFDDARLQNAALLSLPALLQEWLRDPETVQSVAFLNESDLLRRLGFEAVPNRMVYFGVAPADVAVDPAQGEAMQAFLREWSGVLGAWTQAERASVPGQIAAWGRMHAGRLGNDLGVMLEDAGHAAAAEALYRAVWQFDPDNISALLNLSSVISGDRSRDPEGVVEAALAAMVEGLGARLQIWQLARTYGIVRAPEAFAQMGWNWAYSGQARMAVAQVERAAAMMGTGLSPALESLMAEVYVLDNRSAESAAIYRSMLEDPARRKTGLAGLYRLALRNRHIEEARRYLARMAEDGLAAEQVVMEEVLLDLLDGRAAAALARLEDVLMERRDMLRGWILMAEAGFVLEDARTISRALRRIELQEGTRGYYGSIIRARQAFLANNFTIAAESYEAALARRPGHLPLMEELLRLYLFLQQRDGASRYMRALLHQDPDHALALYVRGSLQIADGDYRLAENSLRRSLASTRSPMVLNDLAWLLVQREAYEEAEALAREGLMANREQSALWDTIGVIFMRTDRIDEAERAFSRAIAHGPSNVMSQIHLAEVQIIRGQPGAARELLAQFEPYRDQLPANELALWTRLWDALGE